MQQLTTQYKETTKAALAFSIYEAMGPDRNLRALVNKTGTKLAQLGVWSSKYSWVARCTAYDMQAIERDRKAQEKADEARAKRKAERDARLADDRESMDDERAPLMRATWRKTLNQLTQKLDSGETKGLFGLVSLLKQSMDEERTDRGVVATKQQIELTGANGGPIQIDQWITLRTVIFQALAPYPDARQAVVHAIAQSDMSNEPST